MQLQEIDGYHPARIRKSEGMLTGNRAKGFYIGHRVAVAVALSSLR